MRSQAYTQFNSHVGDLIKPVVVILFDATNVKRLSENRDIHFYTVEQAMAGTLKKKARVNRLLHGSLLGHEIVPAQEWRGNTSVLHTHEDLKVYRTVNVCIEVFSGVTTLRQHYSPPPQIKLDQILFASKAT